MPDKVLPIVTFNLDKERHFKLTLGTLLRFKEATGKDVRSKEVQSAFAGAEGEKQLDYLCALLWAGLAWEDPALKLEAVADLIDFNNIGEIAKKISEAYQLATPEAGQDQPPLAKPANPSP